MEVHNASLRGIGQPSQAYPLEPGGRPTGKAAGRTASGDVVEISSQARRAVKIHGYVQQVLRMPDSRPAAVQAARQALERGELDSPASIAATAQAIADSV